MRNTSWKLVFVLVVSALVASCANLPSNRPLVQKPKQTYDFHDWIEARKYLSPDLIVLSFSGGGLRAAALADAVLTQLEAYGLADKIAIISSTSGGSVTAGFVAAKGVNGLGELKAQFLYHDNTADLAPRLLPSFLLGGNRSQIFSAYLEERLFPGTPQTYDQLMQRWGDSPFVILNASDTSTGRTFEFTQQSFSHLCSDIAQFHISEAVAASASFPFLMNPVPLRNHWDNLACRDGVTPFPPKGFEEHYSGNAYDGRYKDLESFVRARHIHSLRYTYEHDQNNIPYRRIEFVHLLDGGLSDNLAARALLRSFSPDVIQSLKQKGVRRILVVQVNAKSDEVRASIDLSGAIPSWTEVFKTVAFNQIDMATALSSYISKQYWVALVKYVNAGQSAADAITLYPVQVDFDQMEPNSEDQRRVKQVSTWWSLAKEDVDLVETTGKSLLLSHPCFQAFLRDSGSQWKLTEATKHECDEVIQLAENVKGDIVGMVPPPPPPPPAPPPPPPPAPVVQRITLASKALFDFDMALLAPEGKAAIDSQVVGKLAQIQKLEVVLVTGHTDPLGTEQYNQKLSERRADAVRDYLVSKGVPKGKIETLGMGEKQPVAGLVCDQRSLKERIACYALDRRVEVQVKGEAIGR